MAYELGWKNEKTQTSDMQWCGGHSADRVRLSTDVAAINLTSDRIRFFRVPSHWSSLPRVTSHVFEGIRGFWKCFVLITLLRIRLEKLPSKHLDLTFDSCRHVNCEDTETREKMPPSESEDDVLDETPQFYHNEKKTIYIRFVLVARGENDRPIN